MSSGWKFWVDVGGTFTDGFCLSPTGQETTGKVLSSSTCKFSWISQHSPNSCCDANLIGSGADFWTGYTWQLIDSQGNILCRRTIEHFDDGQGVLSWHQPVDALLYGRAAAYELISPEPAPIFLVRRMLRANLAMPLAGIELCLGSTRGTNALLTRTGARLGLIVSQGFGDLLEIGEQQREHLFELEIVKPRPLYAEVFEAPERVLADGTVDVPLDEVAVANKLQLWREQGIESLAVCLIHGYRFVDHERRIAELASLAGFAEISCSHRVAPVVKLVARCETTVLDAYLNGVIRDYAMQIERCLGANSRLLLMTSSGGLVPRSQFTGKDSVLSGPAGGVVGFSRSAVAAGFSQALGFDMGGTSTDVARFAGSYEREYETRKAGIRILTPVMAIETVAAGGGSICQFDGQRLTVGPASAGADPGPACYGRGGPLAITDLNFFLGRLVPEQFPFPLQREPVIQLLQAMRDQIEAETGIHYSLAQLAQGFLEIANQQMALAIRTVSVAKGYDPREHVMVAFGGAGPQHALAVAQRLRMNRVLVHPYASILSAFGISAADRTANVVRSVLQPVDHEWSKLIAGYLAELTAEAERMLLPWCSATERIELRFSADLRFVGTEPTINVAMAQGQDLVTEFKRLHQQWYGFLPDARMEMVSVRGEGVIVDSQPGTSTTRLAAKATEADGKTDNGVPIAGYQTLTLLNQSINVPVVDWRLCEPGQTLTGPALISDRLTTIVVEPDWTAQLLPDRQWLLSDSGASSGEENFASSVNESVDPIRLEVFNHQFVAIARQMGVTLQRTAISVNIKDRLDFSCALFTASGELVVNAPHIPVHLGAMSETVQAIIRNNPNVQPGDVFVTNDPFQGGSHLPDVTVVTPVFLSDTDRQGGSPQFWVANRGHHAEIGGRTPGSMPPDAKTLADEGVLISNFKIMRGGEPRFAELADLLRSGPWPSRSVADNLADIRAQIAANQAGRLALQELARQHGADQVQHYMRGLFDLAEQQIRREILRLPEGELRFADAMDNGLQIVITVERVGSELRVDFSGTSPVSGDNLNANKAICLAALMYGLRCLMQTEVPLNQGILRPLKLHLPECFLNPRSGDSPGTSPAMVGGNVETSQRIVDVFLAALGRAAASQGTMNNWLMGDATFGYYETVGGGSGGTPIAAGVDAIHTHMTNTRLTDPEILEIKYPCVLRQLAIRSGSGGNGRHPGGCGMIREIEFNRRLTLSLLSSRRILAPFGLAGGAPGQPGANWLYRCGSGQWESLPPRIAVEVGSGDRLRLETPGGGGWGAMS